MINTCIWMYGVVYHNVLDWLLLNVSEFNLKPKNHSWENNILIKKRQLVFHFLIHSIKWKFKTDKIPYWWWYIHIIIGCLIRLESIKRDVLIFLNKSREFLLYGKIDAVHNISRYEEYEMNRWIYINMKI